MRIAGPEVQLVRDLLRLERLRKRAVVFAKRVVLADDDRERELAHRAQKLRRAHMRHEARGHVLVERRTIVPMKERVKLADVEGEVVAPGKGEHPLEVL